MSQTDAHNADFPATLTAHTTSQGQPTRRGRLDDAQRAAIASFFPTLAVLVDQHLHGRARDIDRSELVSIAQSAVVDAAFSYDAALGKTFHQWAKVKVQWALRQACRAARIEARFLDMARCSASDFACLSDVDASSRFDREERPRPRGDIPARRNAAAIFAAMEGERQRGETEEHLARSIDAERARALVDDVVAKAPDTFGLLWRAHFVEGMNLYALHQQANIPYSVLRRTYQRFLRAIQARMAYATKRICTRSPSRVRASTSPSTRSKGAQKNRREPCQISPRRSN